MQHMAECPPAKWRRTMGAQSKQPSGLELHDLSHVPAAACCPPHLQACSCDPPIPLPGCAGGQAQPAAVLQLHCLPAAEAAAARPIRRAAQHPAGTGGEGNQACAAVCLSSMLQPISWEISICKARSVPALCTIVSSLTPCSLYSAANPLPCCCRSAALKRCVRLRAAPVWRAWCPLTIRCAARIRRG